MKKEKEQKEDIEIMGDDASISEEELLDHSGDPEITTQEDLEENLPVNEIKISPEELEEIKNSLDDLEKKSEEYLDGWQRSRAEFANYKKRIAREQGEIHQAARGEVIKMYLDITDDLRRALEEKPADGDGGAWADGIEIIYQKLITRLDSEGVKAMDALGQEFDPNIHEALMKEESEEYESGQIIEVMQEGYWIGDKVLRPALVRVAA